MKQFFFVAAGCLTTLLSFAQLKHDSTGQVGKGNAGNERYKKPIPANLPEGTYAKDNKVYIKQGYKAIPDANGKTATIARINAGGGTGTSAVGGKFKCSCGEGGGADDCKVTIGVGTLGCATDKGACIKCQLTVVVGVAPKVAMSLTNPGNSNMNWRNVEIPKLQ